MTDTVGYTEVKSFDTPGCRNPSRDYRRQYQNECLPVGRTMTPARFRMALSDDSRPYEVSTSIPGAMRRLLAGVPKGDRALELGGARAATPEAVSGGIRRPPEVVGYDGSHLDDTRVIGHWDPDERGSGEFLRAPPLPRSSRACVVTSDLVRSSGV